MNSYCINLKKRSDRWRNVQPEFRKLGVKPHRFIAIYRNDGHQGCIESHLELLSQVKKDQVFAIFEDDILALGTGKDIQRAMDQLPPTWDMLYLGATLTKPLERYSENLFRLEGGLTTHAIIYNNQHQVCDHIIALHDTPQVDVFMMKVQEQFSCFVAYPMIVSQAPGKSDIIDRYTDYSEIQETYKKYTE
jgi:hypothetical protein